MISDQIGLSWTFCFNSNGLRRNDVLHRSVVLHHIDVHDLHRSVRSRSRNTDAVERDEYIGMFWLLALFGGKESKSCDWFEVIKKNRNEK